jgi:hypothetical protein
VFPARSANERYQQANSRSLIGSDIYFEFHFFEVPQISRRAERRAFTWISLLKTFATLLFSKTDLPIRNSKLDLGAGLGPTRKALPSGKKLIQHDIKAARSFFARRRVTQE